MGFQIRGSHFSCLIEVEEKLHTRISNFFSSVPVPVPVPVPLPVPVLALF